MTTNELTPLVIKYEKFYGSYTDFGLEFNRPNLFLKNVEGLKIFGTMLSHYQGQSSKSELTKFDQ